MEYLFIGIAGWAVIMGAMVVHCFKGESDPDTRIEHDFPIYKVASRNDQAREIGRFVQGFKRGERV